MSDSDQELPSKRPYMLRALWQWCMDAGLTPQILVNASADGVSVPKEYVKDGAIVLNVHDRAVRSLQMENDSVSFSARFAGRSRNIFIPIEAIAAIYARENGQGLFFEGLVETAEGVDADASAGDDGNPAEPGEKGDEDAGPKRGRPDLRIV